MESRAANSTETYVSKQILSKNSKISNLNATQEQNIVANNLKECVDSFLISLTNIINGSTD